MTEQSTMDDAGTISQWREQSVRMRTTLTKRYPSLLWQVDAGNWEHCYRIQLHSIRAVLPFHSWNVRIEAETTIELAVLDSPDWPAVVARRVWQRLSTISDMLTQAIGELER